MVFNLKLNNCLMEFAKNMDIFSTIFPYTEFDNYQVPTEGR